MIPYGRQTISDDDIEAVISVLRSDFLTQGPVVPQFERLVSDYCGVAHAVAVNSATSALHIACMALGVGSGDVVWTSPNTFVASANCALYCGAEVDFVDIDPSTRNMSVSSLAASLKRAHEKNKLPKVLIPVHYSGLPCDMEQIHELTQQYGVRIIEDASHAIGARYRDSVIGDCRYSDITVFSFHPVKIITTAEGGLCTTGSPELARRMQLCRSHGITREQGELQFGSEGGWYYEQQQLGLNYRLTDMQAALGVSQFSHLNAWVARRHQIADRYDSELSNQPLHLPERPAGSHSALHLYAVQLDSSKTSANRREVFDRLRAAGIAVNVHYIPVHLQPYYQALGFKKGDFPNSENYYRGCLSLPMYPALTDHEQETVITALKSALA
jgi:UDP-4-amino-4,6-dideoxy-N-acetyl-beta-L-altrosamine transaminase